MNSLITKKEKTNYNIVETLFYFPFILLTYLFQWIEEKSEDD